MGSYRRELRFSTQSRRPNIGSRLASSTPIALGRKGHGSDGSVLSWHGT
jgi:hypothetical protein